MDTSILENRLIEAIENSATSENVTVELSIEELCSLTTVSFICYKHLVDKINVNPELAKNRKLNRFIEDLLYSYEKLNNVI